MQASGVAVMRAAGFGLALGLLMAKVLGGSSDSGTAGLGYLVQVMVLMSLLPVFFAGLILWFTGRTAQQPAPPGALTPGAEAS